MKLLAKLFSILALCFAIGAQPVYAQGTPAPVRNVKGSFTITLSTGCTTTPTGTVFYVITGNVAVLNFPSFSCTSNSTSWYFTGVPTILQSANNMQGYAPGIYNCENNTVSINNCAIYMNYN